MVGRLAGWGERGVSTTHMQDTGKIHAAAPPPHSRRARPLRPPNKTRTHLLGEVPGLVVKVGQAPRHAGADVAPRRAQHDDAAARHVLAAVVADALDDGGGTAVADLGGGGWVVVLGVGGRWWGGLEERGMGWGGGRKNSDGPDKGFEPNPAAFLTAKRSPARPLTKSDPPVAP